MSGRLRSLLIALVLTALGYLAYVKIRDSTWQTHLEDGFKAYSEERYADARTQFQAAVDKARRFGERDPRLARFRMAR